MKRKDGPSLWRDMAEIIAVVAVFGLLLWLFLAAVRTIAGYAREGREDGRMKADAVDEEDGVGRATASLSGVFLLGGETDEPEGSTVLRVYTEGVDSPLPEWWDPDEPMAVEWFAEDHFTEAGNMVERVDAGCPDYNIESTLWGWDGHCMENWELEMFSRIVYLEFNGTEPECMNAGIDSILNLWDSGYFGNTLGGLLSAAAENGAYVYTTYGWVWSWDYDYTVLEEIKALCLERFIEGPRYNCHFFQLYGFPVWAEPLYALDSVYFSTFKEGAWN